MKSDSEHTHDTNGKPIMRLIEEYSKQLVVTQFKIVLSKEYRLRKSLIKKPEKNGPEKEPHC